MEGAGRAAGDVYAWAIANPEKVSCVYAENPILRSTMSTSPMLENLAPLAKAGVPLLLVCGSRDPAFDSNARAIENRYKDLGGRIELLIKEGKAHIIQPVDFRPVVDFVAHNAK